MRYNLLLLLAVLQFIILSCQSFETLDRVTGSGPQKTPEWIWISEDPILREVLQESVEVDLFTRSNDFQKIASIEVVSIESDILLTKSLLYSLATLTMGTFERIESEFLFSVKYLDGVQVEEKRFVGKTSYDLRAPMPPYIGLGTTLTLGALDRYKVPEHLREYCLEREPGVIRKRLESDKEGYCTEYKKYLKVAWNSVEPKIDKDLRKRKPSR